MSTAGRLAALVGAAVLVTAVGLGLVLAWTVSEGIPGGTVLVMNGQRFELDRLAAALADHWVLVSLALLAIATLLVAAAPVVLLLAVGLPLLASAVSLAVVLAPAGLLAWWLWRRSVRRRDPAAAPAPER